MKIKEDDIVRVEYVGRFEDGKIFDTSKEQVAKYEGIFAEEAVYEPLVLKVGIEQIPKGIDEALVGMEKGEQKEITLPPEKGYGERRHGLIQKIPMDVFKNSAIEPEVGMQIGTAEGQAEITRVFESEVEIDLNHPLSGKTLIFDIEVVDIDRE